MGLCCPLKLCFPPDGPETKAVLSPTYDDAAHINTRHSGTCILSFSLSIVFTRSFCFLLVFEFSMVH
jgi:hypothetical protein